MDKSVRDHIQDYYKGVGRYHNELPYVTRTKNPEGYTAYNQRAGEIYDNFRSDVEEECAPEHWNQNVKNIVWSRAWEEGHSSGLSETLGCYEDLVYFVQDLLSSGL